jgi:hypothetical protein
LGEIPVLVTGRYATVESVVLLVSEVGRVDAHPVEENTRETASKMWKVTKLPSALGVDGWPWALQEGGETNLPSKVHGPGDAWPLHITIHAQKRVQAASARLESVDGQNFLSVDGFEFIADTCHQPVPQTGMGDHRDDRFSPGVYSIVVGLERSADFCAALAITREVPWHFKHRIQTSPRQLQIVHPTGHVEFIELPR